MTEPEAQKGPSNLVVRLLTAVVAVPILLAALYMEALRPWGFLVIAFVATGVAAFELFAMVAPDSKILRAYGFVASQLVFFAVVATEIWRGTQYERDLRFLFPGLIALVVLGHLVSLVAPDPIERASERSAWMVAGPLYVGGLLGTLELLHLRNNGGSWVVLAMMLAWWGDTGGYFAGRYFGKHKLYEKVSPKKTVEGAIGGLGGAIAGALLAHFWFLPELPLVGGVLLAIVAGALGIFGDLSESLIKRSTGVKDSGAVIPGHGGILDRIDALLFTGAATWIYATWLL